MKKTIKFLILPIMFLMFLTPIVLAQEFDIKLNQNDPNGLPLNQNDPYGLPLNQRNSSKTFQDEITTDTNQTQDSDQTVGGVSIDANDVPNIIRKIALWLYRIVLALSTVFGLYAAFLYLSGNPKNVEKAHQQLKYAFIGVAIAIISFSIEAIVKGIISR
jgi:hypothetical protein